MASINISQHDIKKDDNLLRIGNSEGVLFSSQGSMIKGKVTSVGKDAVVTIGDRDFKVDSDIVKDRNVGDEMMFKVETVDGNKVRLKAMQEYVGAAATGESGSVGDNLSSLNTLKVERDTDQFVSILSQSDLSVDIASDVSDESKQVARLSSDEIKYLRQMGVDVNNASVGRIMGLVNQYRAVEDGRSFVSGSPEVIEAIARAQTIPHVSEGAMHYMMDNNMDFTYDNLYQAEHKGTSYPAIEDLSEESWEGLKPQAESLLSNQGIEVNEDTLSATKWMIREGVDVSPKNMDIYMAVKTYNEQGLDIPSYEANVIDVLHLGEKPETAVISGDSNIRQASDIVEQIQKITPKAIEEVNASGRDINIKNLSAAQKNIDAYIGLNNETSNEPVVVKADEIDLDASDNRHLKNLTEIKLKMTVSSAYTMLKSGLDVETLSLGKVVEELNNLKEPNLDELMRDTRVDMSKANISLYQETMMVTNTIPVLPAETLGVVDDSALTLRGIYQAGLKVSMSLQVAGQTVTATASSTFMGYGNREALASYEALMTAPRADMGDRITDAFANMEGMLDELGIEVNDTNKKAVRILAYNQMEINKNSVERISSIDIRLNEVLDGMKPETVLGMIRDNVNPLELSLDELSREIAIQEEKNGKSAEQKYSEFLVNLDSKGDITSEERESYIGIYRLINSVTSFSDRDLGNVIRNGEEITLESLLRSHRSRNAKGMDVALDDDFGMVTGLNRRGKDIIEQVMSAFDNEEVMTVDKEVIGRLDDVSDESVNLLKSLKLPYTPAYIEAANQVMTGSGEFYQNIKEQLKIRNTSNVAFDELEEKIYSHLESLDDEVVDTETLSESDSPIDLYKDNWFVNAFADAFHESDMDVRFTARDLIAGNRIQAMMRVANAVRREESEFMIPIAMDEEVLTMNVSFVKNKESAVKMSASVETRSVGYVSGALVEREGSLSLDLFFENAEGVDRASSFADSIREELNGNGVGISSVNMNVGEFSPMSYEGIEDGVSVSSKVLYETAKELVALIRRL